ncbi:hypothetical protein [Gilvibacter sp.]|uniref:hypothetical protein n=1 Tax=Gilvibacter sp. TaxID=2729997 RepID=UPI003F49F165
MIISKSKIFLLAIVVLFSINQNIAQELFTEVGVGIGNVIGEEHRKGKAEIYFNVIKPFSFGEVGLDIATGGNFIPGNISGIEDGVEILSPNDAKYTAVTAFYRLSIFKNLYLEPRVGYASLYYFINADDDRKISKSNLAYGLGIGATILKNFSLSLRYQHLGTTPSYEGTKQSITIISNSEALNLVLLRVAYRFNWNSIF